ncbi:MAG: hypothetical protein ABIP71_16405 [Verrucomicrobiota bacterium]
MTELRFSGKISGSLNVPPDKQGKKGFDDYTIRVDLVESGKRTLNWWEKKVSPDSIKTLFALAPSHKGIGKIHFPNVGTDAKQIGKARTHPLSDLMEETVVTVADANGRFSFTNRFARPMSVLAAWNSSDGDDTKSNFAVPLDELEIRSGEPKK